MDSGLPQSLINQQKRKPYVVAIILLVIALVIILMLRHYLGSSIERSAITVATVEQGTVENTITAAGEVLPEFEEVITSPINASVQQVLMDAGSNIKAGQSVLTLDKSATQVEYEKLKFQLESKHNDVTKLRLQLNKSFYDIKSNNDIKQLRINSLEADVENAKRLLKAGGGTRETVEQAELNLKVAKLEKQQLENEIKSKQQTMQVEMKEAEIAAAIQQNDLHELERKLRLANIVGSREGVVTWVNKNIGATVREGDALARIADLSSFKIQGSISDTYLDQLHNSMPAIIRINETLLRGTVVNIQPSVQNAVASFEIRLNEQNSKILRPNLKADVYLVTASKSNVMRVTNGPAFRGTASQDIFIVENAKAIKRTVAIGLSNFDYVEIKTNVRAGDKVITSDMSDYKNTNEITLKN